MPERDPFRRKDLVQALAAAIASDYSGLGPMRIMHVCGTHERSLNRFGLRALLPAGLRLVAGPGCPVCVCPVSDLLAARALALRPGTLLASFGDMLAVPMPGGSLLDARREGAEVRVVYSAADALELARAEPGKEVVFLSVGFETTAATTAALLAGLEPGEVPNFSVLASQRAVPAALRALLGPPTLDRQGYSTRLPPIDGMILPGHVAAIVGSEAFRFLVRDYGIPCVVAGFEPVDLLAALRELLGQRRRGEPELANAYSRVVRPRGNTRAAAAMGETFERVDAEWRGLGVLPGTGLALATSLGARDARAKHRDYLARTAAPEAASGEGAEDGARDGAEGSCLCSRVVLGLAESEDCPSFGKGCLPERPLGPCMVSEEGTCRIRLEYGVAG
jgi:hydrogenase expression/formation protein HypD